MSKVRAVIKSMTVISSFRQSFAVPRTLGIATRVSEVHWFLELNSVFQLMHIVFMTKLGLRQAACSVIELL